MPFSILLLFTISYFLHLTARFPALGAIRFDFILMIVLFVFFLLSIGDTIQRYKDSDITKKLTLFIAFILFSIPLVKWPGSVVQYGTEWYLKVVFFYFFIIAFVTTEKQLKIFIAVFLGCQVFRGLEPAWLHYTTGYWGDAAFSHIGGSMQKLDRLSGAPHDVVNPNQLAWVIVNITPFIFFIGWLGRDNLFKVFSIVISAGLLYTIMLTGSRSGLISLFAVLLGIVYFSEKRWRNLVILCFLVVPVAIVVSGLLRPDLAERYRSIFDSSAVGGDTAQGRISGLKKDFSTVMNLYGLFGHGLGSSIEVNVNYLGSSQPSHNLYIEILQEVGVVGFILFFQYIYLIFKSLILATKRMGTSQNDFMSRVIHALLVWEFMQIIYALSCFGLSSWEWYLFGGLTSVTLYLLDEQTRKISKIYSNTIA